MRGTPDVVGLWSTVGVLLTACFVDQGPGASDTEITTTSASEASSTSTPTGANPSTASTSPSSSSDGDATTTTADYAGHYGDPAMGCLADEIVIEIRGIAGSSCGHGPCTTDSDCPPTPPSSRSPGICFVAHPNGNDYCIIPCEPSLPGCPDGMSCEQLRPPFDDSGVCMYL